MAPDSVLHHCNGVSLDLEALYRLIDELRADEAALVHDPELNALLDPLRGHLPIRVVCGVRGCRRQISYWGLPVRGSPGWSPPALRGRGFRRFEQPKPEVETGYVAGTRPNPVAGAMVMFGHNGPRKPNLWKNRIPANQLGPQPPFPYDVWSLPPVMPQNVMLANPEGVRGYRKEFACLRRGCPGRYPLTNSTMLRMVVRAIANDWPEIMLPDGLQPPAK